MTATTTSGARVSLGPTRGVPTTVHTVGSTGRTLCGRRTRGMAPVSTDPWSQGLYAGPCLRCLMAGL